MNAMLRVGVMMYQTSYTKGQELVAEKMVKELRRQGHEAYLISSIYHDGEETVSEDEVEKRGGYVHAFDDKLGIPVVRVASEKVDWPPRRIGFRGFVSVLTQLVQDLKLNVLVTHSTLWNGPEEVAKFVAWRRSRAQEGAPQTPILFCHMSHFQEPSDERYTVDERTYREAWNKVSLSQIIREADYLLVTTPFEKRAMEDLGADEKKCFLFPGGIDDETLEFEGDLGADGRPNRRQDVREKYRLPKGKKLVTFLGSIEERKNPALVTKLAMAMTTRNDVHFVISGHVEGEYGEQVKRDAQRLPNVSFIDEIPEKDKGRLISESYLNISPSRSESLGIAQLEFMFLGVPVITSGVGGQSWIVTDGITGVVLKGPDDIDGAKDAIAVLASHRGQRDKLARRAAKFASAFTLTRLVHKLAETLSGSLATIESVNPQREEFPAGEKLIDAKSVGGQRLAVTAHGLIISFASDAKSTLSIPYNEISKVVRHVRTSWPVLAVGALVSLAFYTLVIAMPNAATSIVTTVFPALIGPSAWLILMVFPLLPVFIAGVIFGLALKEGYMVYYGKSKKIFLAKPFKSTLKTADRLLDRHLISGDE